MINTKIMEERKQLVRDEIGIWEAMEYLNEEQFKKVGDLVFSMLTDEQIDNLYFEIVD